MLDVLQPATLISLVTLTLMEIVLGIDNIVFIAILVGRLPRPQQPGTRRIGLLLALVMRLGLLFSITWIVFSLDSVVTAVGLATQVWVMVVAMVAAVGFMLAFAGTIGDFVNRHPSMKILALSFLILIGVLLIAEGMGQHISRGYAYFAMAFSLGVELLNMRLRGRQQPVMLHTRYEEGQQGRG